MILLAVVLTVLTTPSLQDPQPVGLHFVIERDFIYMAATRTLRSEHWISGDKAYQKLGDMVVITRKDLGVRWVVNSAAKTYTERPLKVAGSPSGQEKASVVPGASSVQEDLRTAGFRYEPVYDWTITETGEAQNLNGRSCSKVTALGDADYAESKLVLWLCPREGSDSIGDSNTAVLDLIRSDSIRKLVEEQLAKRGNPILMSFEENTEPAIAPTTIVRIRIKTLESAPVPAGLFDLPAGVQKSAQPQ